MTITSITKDGGYLVIVEDGVTKRRSIVYTDAVVSEPPTDYEEVGNIYINSSGNLVVNYNGSSFEIEGGSTGDLTGAEIVTLLQALAASDRLEVTYLKDGTTYIKYTANEKTKLSAIETSATADQTGVEIVALLEALTAGNRLSHTKLDDVGASDHHAKYLDSAAKAAAVQAGAITNGVTKAPTHDAVFDVKATAEAAQTAAEVDDAIGTHADLTATHGVGEIVGRTEAQTLTNKTLTAPIINGTVTTTGLTLPAHSSGDISLGANELKTTNNIIKERSSRIAIRNAADDNYGDLDLKAIRLRSGGFILSTSSSVYIAAPGAANAYMSLKAWNGAAQVEIARLEGAAAPTFDLYAGRLMALLDANSQQVSNLPAPVAANDAARKAYVDAGGEGHITILPFSYQSIGQGTWSFAIDNLQMLNLVISNTASLADGDNISWNVYLAVGTYTLLLLYYKSSSHGILDIDLAGGEIGSIDQYAAGTTRNQLYTIAAIGVVAAGIQTLTCRVDGKHGSSSNYKVIIAAIMMWRTA